MLLSATDIISQSIELYKKHWKLYLRYAVLFLIPIVGINVAAIKYTPEVVNGFSPVPYLDGDLFIYGIITFLFTVLSLWFTIVFIQVIVRTMQGDEIESLQLSLKKATHLVVPGFIVSLMVAIAVIAGLFLLIIPGVIFSVWFSFVLYEVIFEGKKGMDALHASKGMVTGRWFDVLWRLVAPIAVFYVAVRVFTWLLTFPLPQDGTSAAITIYVALVSIAMSLLFIPLTTLTPTILYLDLKKNPAAKKKA